MNQALRSMLILGCLMLAVLEAPRSSTLMVEDLGGPYCVPQGPQTALVEPAAPALLAASNREADSAGLRADTGTK